MSATQPINKSKQEYAEIINKISKADSSVGIDAQYTHAIIIDYLQQITKRLETLESLVKKDKP